MELKSVYERWHRPKYLTLFVNTKKTRHLSTEMKLMTNVSLI